MVRVELKDLIKAINLLSSQSSGGPVGIKADGVTLRLQTTDRQGKDMVLELSDVQYPMMPKVTKTETF